MMSIEFCPQECNLANSFPEEAGTWEKCKSCRFMEKCKQELGIKGIEYEEGYNECQQG